MKRSWADVVKDPPTQPTQPKTTPTQPTPQVTQNKVQQQLAEIAEKLKLANAGKITHTGNQPAGTAPPPPPATPQVDMGVKPHMPTDAAAEVDSPSKSALTSSLKQLEVALAALPEGQGNDEMRTRIAANIEEQKGACSATRDLLWTRHVPP